MSRLVIAYPGRVHVDDNGLVTLDEKLRTGMVTYAERWPGGDVVLAAVADSGAAGSGPENRWHRSSLPFEVVVDDNWRRAVDHAKGTVFLLPLIARLRDLEDLLDRSVLTAEFTPEDLRATELGSAVGVARLRVLLGSTRRTHDFTRWVKRARGIQCNGYAAYERFRDLSPDPLLYFDTRLTGQHVARARQLQRAAPAATPTLAFSGRLIAAKGPEHAVRAFHRLRELGIEGQLLIFGQGVMEPALRDMAGPSVHFKGLVDFATEWTDLMTEHVDLMLLPHTQGDPSGTYLEAVGCGVPVMGFDNVALRPLEARHGLATTVPMRDSRALADRAKDLLTDPAAWAAQRGRGLEFMAAHTYEDEMSARIDHLIRLSS